MMINKYGLILVASIINFFILVILKLPIVKGGLISIGLLTVGYIVYMRYKQAGRYKILEEDLDPEGFIEASHKAYKYAGDNREINNLLNIDYATAYISLGEYEKALEFLEKLDSKKLNKPRSLILIYYNLMIIVCGELGMDLEVSRAFEQAQAVEPRDKASLEGLKIIRSNYYIVTGDYKEARKNLEDYRPRYISRRMELEILFDLARIDEQEGRIKEASLKYRQVYEGAGKLHIARMSRDALKKLGEIH